MSESTQLLLAALTGIAVIVVLITAAKLHPFLSLTLGSLTVGAVAGLPMADTVESFSAGVGSTVAGVGMLIALGAMFGKLLADSGGADQIVDTIIGKSSDRMLPWSMAGIGALIGLPMFFEIGLVLLMPVIFLVARRSGRSLVALGIPALAGLSAMHGFVPPHPGPLAAVGQLDADLGLTLGLGVIVAIPTIVVAGPLFARLATTWVDVPPPSLFDVDEKERSGDRPSFPLTLATVLLPVVLMLGKTLADILDAQGALRSTLDFIGTPLIALLISVLVALFTFGSAGGMSWEKITDSIGASLGPIAGIVFIVAAGGGFKQTLVDTGIADVVAEWVEDSNLSVLLVAWLVAVLIRLATGSATVATVTAAGIMVPLAEGLPTAEVSLLVLAIGAGSVFFSHVNDAGFWLVKEYFGMTIGQTIKTWSLMETVLSVSGLIFVMLLGLVV
ncbi:GntP family permease [Aeromicrobium duanguangcaii]|uniref:GntP family permease n=1 Tax=Aeromicrobium duanguangcaii TaxID=2968086 RepID=A0ABY5KJ27_9ACTN|nr:gluconate:H+ symporter [Aeromicrobium duanguangcaii]MCD9152906.1 GntP family permease [Aeromicrobium duanguangcaii]UUI69988.1 GntP family permease [Aeromicrobium duanguangcaii]